MANLINFLNDLKASQEVVLNNPNLDLCDNIKYLFNSRIHLIEYCKDLYGEFKEEGYEDFEYYQYIDDLIGRVKDEMERCAESDSWALKERYRILENNVFVYMLVRDYGRDH